MAKSKKNKLGLAILWHHHQPYYKSSKGGLQMPWVRFHGTKDYLDLLLVLKEFPQVKQNFNLVPSLIKQIRTYQNNSEKDLIWTLTEKPADQLIPKEKEKILHNFFLNNINNMIKPYKRYYDLYLKYKNYLRHGVVERNLNIFSADEYRDLQIWYNLSWIGMESRKRPVLKKLFDKGKGFSEQDKKILFDETAKILAEIIPLYHEMWDQDQIELSTSPFYHPILPLLCDNRIGRESSSAISLPQLIFSHPEDAEIQIQKGIEYFEEIFHRRPNGIWPSEGSVSMDSLDLIARHGIMWVATDEGILANTLRKEFMHPKIYQAYSLNTGNNRINVFFRDHYLSDAIGFVYSNWSAEQAVEDLMNRLYAIRNLLIDNYGQKNLSRFVVPIILDGENCWEYYEGDGKPFLRKLFQELSDNQNIETITFSDHLKRNRQPEKLHYIFPGSWINSNFNIWIGSEEDNKSWDALTHTRNFLNARQREGMLSEDQIKRAWEQIYIAEGSDWNWWYGDEHTSANDLEFDLLYREHLMEVYRILDAEIPALLYQTIKHVHRDRFVGSTPTNLIHPLIDGRSTHFYEWVGSAIYEVGKMSQSSMHQVVRIMDALYVGFDVHHLYLRVDFLSKPDALMEFVIAIKRPRPITVVVSPLRGIAEKFEMVNEVQRRENLSPMFKLERILELAIRFDDLGVAEGDILGWQVGIKLNGKQLEEFPRMNLIEIEVPGENFDFIEWSV